jgi:polar amino acid transport system substrate-binding protein
MNSNPIGSIVALALVASAGFYFSDMDTDLAGAATGQGATCGAKYYVIRGDTLHKIATRAYGTGNYRVIAEANSDTLADIARIEIGDELLIPCLDGAIPKIGTPIVRTAALAPVSGGDADLAVLAPPDPETTTAPATALAVLRDDGGIGLVAGPDFAPFSDPALPEGGMIAELVRLAMSSAAQERTVKVAVVDDWTAHLDLLEQGTFDLGFPWYRPDCARVENLGESMQRRCAGFDFSDPLFEVAIAYYVLAADPLTGATGYDQLSGRRICRPANYFTFDLEQEGLVAPNASIIIARTSADCFNRLMRGSVDVVSLSKPLAQDQITGLGLDGQIAEIPALASVQTLHVVAPKGDPDGRAYLDLVNSGLAELQSSGRWHEVVSRHLGAFGMQM